MKVKSEWKGSTYYFNFFVDEVHSLEDGLESKEAIVATSVMASDQSLIWSGAIRVKWNETGIYPNPKDLHIEKLPNTAKQSLLVELRRYIKPQRAFL
ncbi:MAG: hypothetical protein ACI35R_01625 [Bacillus sp. (in: firmicutes)]